MADHPTLAAELGHAVARGWTTLTLADAAILARYPDTDEAKTQAIAMRRAAKVWRHIRGQLRLRIYELAAAELQANTPLNAIMAKAHEINRTQTLAEDEVNAAVREAAKDAEEEKQRRLIRRGRRVYA